MMTTFELVRAKAEAAHKAACALGVVSAAVKNKALLAMADALLAKTDFIIGANDRDMQAARENGMKESMQDRLRLTPERIEGMAEGLRQVAALPDPVGNVIGGQTLANGLKITKVRVPLGVIGIIYEARPNVTSDAAAVLTEAAEAAGIPQGAIQFIDTAERAAVTALIKLNDFVDVVIPRGGAGLIKAVVQNATVPVIETGSGVCHTYVDAAADCAMARKIAFNAKVQRPSVCNAMETLLVHKDVAGKFLPQMLDEYFKAGVTVFGCPATQEFDERVQPATEEDWATEYGDLRLSVKIVEGIDEALEHIAKYGTKHSECIVTEDYNAARKFQDCVDAAAVYVNASTRFTDGFEFGFGAEIGISTQKLHARGPMALPELTSYKFLINGSGQTRG